MPISRLMVSTFLNLRRTLNAALPVLAVLWIAAPALSGDTFAGIADQEIECISSRMANFEPNVADEIDTLRAEHPQSKIPVILDLSRRYWQQFYVAYDPELSKAFEDDALLAIKQIEQETNRFESRFAKASIESLLTQFYIEHGQRWKAAWKARSSLKLFQAILAERPELHDAKLSIGLAICYQSSAESPFARLISPKGQDTDLETGIERISDAKRLGVLTRAEAPFRLARVLEKEPGSTQRAHNELVELADRYPNNLHFRTELAMIENRLGDKRSSHDHARSVVSDPRIDAFPGIEVQALNSLMWSSYAIGDYPLAIEAASRLQKLASLSPELAYTASWARLAQAEALLAQGEIEGAVQCWDAIPPEHSEPYQKALIQLLKHRK